VSVFFFSVWVLGIAEEIAVEGGFTCLSQEASGVLFPFLLLPAMLPAGLRVNASMRPLNG